MSLIPGKTYKLTKMIDGNQEGTPVVFKWMTKDNKWAICNPVGEPDMQSSFSVKPSELAEIGENVSYQITLSPKQANVLVEALDVYSRIGMGQLEIVEESIRKQYGFKYPLNIMDIIRNCLNTAKIALGHPVNGSYGIAGPDTPKSSQIAYDLQCVLRKQIADQENHGSHSVWHHDPLHTAHDVELAEVRVVERNN